MPTYIVLSNFTEQGINNIKESPRRVQQGRELLQELGGSLTAFYLTMGQYDSVAIIEAPDAGVAARFLLKLGAQGNVRTTTLNAFDEEAFSTLVEEL